ncbi:secreted protein [Beggiatoa sp. PS]|nr:secreted protein [Beggiatoa sp. PS]
MKTLAKAIALSAILGGAVIATPAQAWFGGFPGGNNGWGGGPWGGNGGPWGGYPGNGYGNTMDDWMDGNGWGDMTFSTSMGGRGNGRGYNRYYQQPNYGYGGYPGYGYGAPYGGGYGAPYGGGYGAPYGGGYGAAPYSGRDYQAPPAPPAPAQKK